MNYNDLSRRGLIKLNGDFDEGSNNALHNFLNSESSNEYEAVRAYEKVAERVDELSEKIEEKGGVISSAILSRVDSVFDTIIETLTEEADRCAAVLDGEEDNDYAEDDEVG